MTMRESVSCGKDRWFVRKVKDQRKPDANLHKLVKEISGPDYGSIEHFLPQTAVVTLADIESGKKIVQEPPVSIHKDPRRALARQEVSESDGFLGMETSIRGDTVSPDNLSELLRFASEELGYDIEEAVWQAVGQASLTAPKEKKYSMRTNE